MREDHSRNYNKVFEYIKENPLATKTEIADAVGLKPSTIERYIAKQHRFVFEDWHPLMRERDRLLKELAYPTKDTNVKAIELYLKVVAGYAQKLDVDVNVELKTLSEAINQLGKDTENNSAPNK